MLLKVSLPFSLIAIGLVVGAWATSIYYIKIDSDLVTMVYTFYWREYKVKTTFKLTDESSTTKRTYGDDEFHDVSGIFRVILITLSVGGGLQVILFIINLLRVLIKKIKSRVIRFVAFALALMSVPAISIAFFWIFNLPNAFKNDEFPACLNSDLEFKKFNCHNIMGKGDGTGFDITYRPDIGWWLLIGAIIASTVALSNTMRSRRSIP